MSTSVAEPNPTAARPFAPPERYEVRPIDDLVDYVQAFARQKPGTTALICLAVGFVLGWKLKLW